MKIKISQTFLFHLQMLSGIQCPPIPLIHLDIRALEDAIHTFDNSGGPYGTAVS